MIQWVADKLVAWGQWLQTDRGVGSAGLSAKFDGVGSSNWREAVIPIRSIDTSRTHDWVLNQPVEDQRILLEVYCTPHTVAEQVKVLKMSTRTLYSRLHILHTRFARDYGDWREARAAAISAAK